MTKQDWFKMNKGCNGSGDFDYNMLYVIYDNCAQEPLRLRGEKDGYGTAIVSDPENSEQAPITIPAPPPHEDNYLRSLAVHITNVLMFWSTYFQFRSTHANHKNKPNKGERKCSYIVLPWRSWSGAHSFCIVF
jgi:hypothetical protein